MKLTLGWFFGGLVAFIFFLIVYMPANQVVGRIALPKNISITGVSGTVWNGKAKEVVMQGLPLKRVDWSLHPLALITGRLSANIKAGNIRNSEEAALSGPLSVSLFNFKNIKAEDFVLYLPANYVVANLTLPIPVDAGGRLRVRIEQGHISPQCQELSGFGDWLNASVAGTQGPIQLGNYTVKFSCKGENIAAVLSDPNLLNLGLNADLNPENGKINVAGQFRIDPSLPQDIQYASQFFGQKDSEGFVRFKL